MSCYKYPVKAKGQKILVMAAVSRVQAMASLFSLCFHCIFILVEIGSDNISKQVDSVSLHCMIPGCTSLDS